MTPREQLDAQRLAGEIASVIERVTDDLLGEVSAAGHADLASRLRRTKGPMVRAWIENTIRPE